MEKHLEIKYFSTLITLVYVFLHLSFQSKIFNSMKRYESYQNKNSKQINHGFISNENLLLVKYVISSNASLSELANPYLIQLFRHFARNAQINTAHYSKFKNTLLPEVMRLMYDQLDLKLNAACSVTIIVDMWSKNASDFIAVGASLMHENYEREVVIIGMMRMTEAHTAEHVKNCVEKLVNRYQFDKGKVDCKFLDLELKILYRSQF